MKILLLGLTKLKYMPYINFYLNQLDDIKHEIHVCYWERDRIGDISIDKRIALHRVHMDMSDAIPLKKKMSFFIKYRKFAKHVIKDVSPDFIIVMHSTTALLIMDDLCLRYKGRYIFDYRDVTYERNCAYRWAVAEVLKKAKLTFTSSDGFRKYLPEVKNLYTSHNISMLPDTDREVYLERLFSKQEPIRIAFWGLLRHLEINKKIISAFAMDKRFELHYYGRAQGMIGDYIISASKKWENIFFHGEYELKDRNEMAKETDLLHNIYDNSDKTTPLAMGNKYYDGLIYYIPQLCMSDSYMGKRSARVGVGIECNPYGDDFSDKVYQYYFSLDRREFVENCDKELDKVKLDMKKAETIIFNIGEET